MREIKFRAWNGSVMRYTTAEDMPEFCVMDGKAYTLFDGESCFPKARDWPVMQYTGLKGKNGKEIYEGDLLGGTYEFSEVGWCEVCGGWQCFYDYHDEKVCHCCDGNFLWRELIDDQSEVEVIGNIHENPELPESP